MPLRASQAGADEFVLAPVNYEELQSVLARAIEKRAHEMEGRRVVQQLESKSAFCSLIGASAAMQKLYQTIQAVADSNTTVVLRGESGTGKELIANAIVQSSDRADQPYICVNCSALPESLIESELFGYEKGAFTGADTGARRVDRVCAERNAVSGRDRHAESGIAEQTAARAAGADRAAAGRTLVQEN